VAAAGRGGRSGAVRGGGPVAKALGVGVDSGGGLFVASEQIRPGLERFKAGGVTLDAIKRRLYALAEEYEQPYLLESYYFWL